MIEHISMDEYRKLKSKPISKQKQRANKERERQKEIDRILKSEYEKSSCMEESEPFGDQTIYYKTEFLEGWRKGDKK